MPDHTVGRGEMAELGRIEGDLKVGRNATIKAQSGRKVVVTGGVVFETSAKIDCDLECQSMKVEGRGYGPRGRSGPAGNIIVKGNLTVHGGADVLASLEVVGDLKAEEVDIAGHLKCKSLVSKRARVGGHMEAKGTLEAQKVDVGGHMSVLGSAKLGDLHVGGHARVGGGVISGDIKVKGQFTTGLKLEFGELEIFGHLKLPADSKGERLVAFGKVEFLGDAFCRIVQVKGSVRVAGNFAVEDAEVSGKLEVSGSLNATKELKVYGVAEVKKQVKCESIMVGGRLRANSVMVDGQADIDGEVESTRGLKAKSILVRRGSRVVGPLVGEQVEIGKAAGAWRFPLGGRLASSGRNTSVEDAHGGAIKLGPASRARLVFAEDLEMDDGSHADQVTYTKILKLHMSNLLSKPPVKTSQLPEPPL